MVNFKTKDLKRSMDLGLEAAEMITKTFERPIQLEFEKCYYPFLLISKKRYAALMWTNPDKYDKMDTKGIETVSQEAAPGAARQLPAGEERGDDLSEQTADRARRAGRPRVHQADH
eukprot:2623102-Pyramimonas_sp.AAC.2